MVEQAACDLKASPHPAGERLDNIIFPVLQLNERKELGDPLVPQIRRNPVEPAVEVHILECRQFLVKALVLEDDTDGFPDPVLVFSMSIPLIVAEPEVGLSIVASMERVVVFPAPFGPRSPKFPRARYRRICYPRQPGH